MLGFGWFTINIQFAYTYHRADGEFCKLIKKGCDSYISVFINDENVLKTPKQKNKTSYDADITFTSAKISKQSKVRIEVRDASSDALILVADGNIESFLNKHIHEGQRYDQKQFNSIETVSFWRNEYE